MASQAETPSGSPTTAVLENGSTPATDLYAGTATPYPSQAPSSIPPALPPTTLPRLTPTGPDAKERSAGATKDAKGYWKLKYAGLEQQKQLGRKRRNGGGYEDHDRTKRRQAVGSSLPASNVDGDGPIAASVALGNISVQGSNPEDLGNDEQMQLLGADVDLHDPKARQDLHQLHNAALSFGDGKCKFVNGKWKLEGFGTSLFHHQVIGVSWMLGRELHPTGAKGGILADDMGLGKTVQLLACMSQNLPGKKNSKASKTLIVGPKRLLAQWREEIYDHCSNKKMKRVCILGANREVMRQDLDEAQIILTNYTHLQRQLPSQDELEQIEKLRAEGNPKWKTLLRDHAGCLFRTDWYRVVLDEAHAINNRSSQTSRACRLLIRRHSWVLTGTPMTNNTHEFFPYLDFIRTTFSNFGEYQHVMGDIANIPEDRPTELIMVEFSGVEGDMHKELRDKHNTARELNKASQDNKRPLAVPKGVIIRLFNQLRYFTSHPALVDPNYLSKQSPQPDIKQEEPTEVIKTAAFHYFCRACCNALVDPYIAACGHAFCKNCLKKAPKGKQPRICLSCGTVPVEPKPGGDDCYRHTTNHFERLMERFGDRVGTKAKRTKRVRNPGDDEFGLQPRLAQRKRKGRRKANKGAKTKGRGSRKGAKAQKDATVEEIRAHARDFLRECDKKPWDPVPHSAKTSAAMNLVKKWQTEAPGDKIIIFVQWIPMLSFLGRMLFQNGLKFVYLWGEMESNQQEMCINAFKELPEIKVMLISVTCGAHGLNLTAANRAIVYDHWWHEGWERQAFARVHRIGQKKEVHTAKLVAAGSMDEAILTMQATKRESIGAAVGDGPSRPGFRDICDSLHNGGHLDKELLELTRLEDLSDEDRGEDSGSESEGEGEGDSDEDDSDDDDDDDDSDSDATTGSLAGSEEYQPSSHREADDEGGEEASSDDE
ncbi:P-loop containing nucleoside triphosphate hydrolase protein [Chaetomidium leptoderma]|uniref:P-loop containing nucleoside triphosphate hydrolase protein n=1 Tax=Chaetomidium leptoderma TaxID=669021 RepID=A0AAN6ZVP6_9PEZI|nr:P-loop containing nucleoside triphosphate hydrolase protein [Chaetomidium leptoderma]